MTVNEQLSKVAPIVPRRAAPDSAIKTVVLPLFDDGLDEERIEAALSLARACSAHVSCLHVTPVETYVALDTFGDAFVMKDVMRAVDERTSALQIGVEERLKREHVSWDYEELTGDFGSLLTSRAALADMLITSRPAARRRFPHEAVAFLGDLLHRLRAPLLILGSDGSAFDPTGRALITWNGSLEAAHAVRASRGLLKLATSVQVLQITQGKQDREDFPATKLLEYLSHHSIHAELMIEASPTGDAGHNVIAGMIIAHAKVTDSAYAVLGGYSHNRIGEYVFGGVTRTLLKGCPVSLVIAH